MKKKYVDVEFIIQQVQRNLIPGTDESGMVSVEEAERWFLNLLEKAPKLEVVYCKDCGYYKPNWLPGRGCYDNYGICTAIDFLAEEYKLRFDTSFCSDGIPKEPENNK